DAWLELNSRAIDIITANMETPLNRYLGWRRVVMLNIAKWREQRTSPLAVIDLNHNAGLDWLEEYLDVVYALAYMADDWHGSLALPKALLKLIARDAA
ncbi:MAG TPA: hypothetical protein VH164_15755, partial [Ktedonobacteraceae bacterium]|nr:hypothetical protein [Ktedonobacteraceae bacterium]